MGLNSQSNFAHIIECPLNMLSASLFGVQVMVHCAALRVCTAIMSLKCV